MTGDPFDGQPPEQLRVRWRVVGVRRGSVVEPPPESVLRTIVLALNSDDGDLLHAIEGAAERSGIVLERIP